MREEDTSPHLWPLQVKAVYHQLEDGQAWM